MASLAARLNEDICPIPDQIFRQLRQALPPDAVDIAITMPEAQRARLVAFCYNKRHLYALGLKIASTCSHDALTEACGALGDTIYRQSRDVMKTFSEEIIPPGSRPKKRISLAQVNNH